MLKFYLFTMKTSRFASGTHTKIF